MTKLAQALFVALHCWVVLEGHDDKLEFGEKGDGMAQLQKTYRKY
jgi:hypothetical protein